MFGCVTEFIKRRWSILKNIKLKYFIAVILILISVSGCGLTGNDPVKKGKRLLESRSPADWYKAAENFKKSLKSGSIVSNLLARSYRKIAKKCLERASIEVGKIESRFNDEVKIRKEIADSPVIMNLFNEALTNLITSSRVMPSSKFTYYYLGVGFGQMARIQLIKHKKKDLLKKARNAYILALKLDPKYIKARYGLSMVYLITKKYTAAIEHILTILKMSKRNKKAYFALGRIYYEMKKYKKAENAYRILLEILPRKSRMKNSVRRNIEILESLNEKIRKK